ncbi:TPA: hypothetical protein N0F65_011309 [Lagenidium giganteum]|uniref:Uncharacterized protein n=1 Tax=Lagenidium giganteum TaxID=4803 RepID=A0AAV2YFS0_9STRA|nr:TPA: hypothetical protein N0F65_011309 [Lagenidium giganteum]
MTLREVCMQLDTCMRSNDSLQAMLHNSEIEARERAIEIQQLAEENLMLRRRCDQIEGKYLEERKHSLALEQQLYHLHTMSIQSRAQDTISIGSHSRSPSTQDLASFEPNQTLYQAQSSMDFSTEGQR